MPRVNWRGAIVEARVGDDAARLDRQVGLHLGGIGDGEREGLAEEKGDPVEVRDVEPAFDVAAHVAQHGFQLLVLEQAPEPDFAGLGVLLLGQDEIRFPVVTAKRVCQGLDASPFLFVTRESSSSTKVPLTSTRAVVASAVPLALRASVKPDWKTLSVSLIAASSAWSVRSKSSAPDDIEASPLSDPTPPTSSAFHSSGR